MYNTIDLDEINDEIFTNQIWKMFKKYQSLKNIKMINLKRWKKI